MGDVIIRLADQPELTEPANPIRMRRLVDGARHGGSMSVTWVRLDGRHVRLRTDATDRAYVVLDGTGRFAVDGDDPADVGPGDAVWIPAGTPYVFEGALTYVVINAPAYRDGDDVILE